MNEIKILAIIGSLRNHSYNQQLAAIASQLCEEHIQLEILEYSDIPYFNEDIEYPTPECIQQIRQKVSSADGIWFFTPEYNHSYPGVLKNLLDWLSRPDSQSIRVLNQKPAAISGITPGMSGTAIAQDQLITLLSFLNMNIMNSPRLTIPNAFHQIENNQLILKESLPFLTKQYQEFIKFIQKNNTL